MWSMGCIIAELYAGQPLFPGESTINQLERVIEITGKPSKPDMKAIKSKYTTTMLDTINVKQQK